MSKMLWVRLMCRLFGHDVYATGREGMLLYEVRCIHCRRTYVAHSEHPRVLIPADRESDAIFRGYQSCGRISLRSDLKPMKW